MIALDPAAMDVDRKRETPPAGSSSTLLHFLALSSFAIAQPLFDVSSREAQFFLAHGAHTPDLIAIVATLCWLPAVVAWSLVLLAGAGGRAARTAVSLTVVAVFSLLIALPILKGLAFLPGALALGAAGLGGLGVAILYWKKTAARMFLAFLSPAALIFPALFLASDPIREVLATGREPVRIAPIEVPTDVPVFLIVLDALPLSALLDEQRELDPVRYPNFARLAETSTWFRNATTVAAQTRRALPALVTGRYPPPDPRILATIERFPENLFTWLGGGMKMRIHEDMTRFCPPELTGLTKDRGGSTAAQRASAMLRDLSVVYLHFLLPRELAVDLPPVTGTWKGFRKSRTEESASGRPAIRDRKKSFERFVDAIEPGPGASLDYVHILLPHYPWEYLPSGKRYNAAWIIPGWENPEKGGRTWAEDVRLAEKAYQRMLLQLGALDRLLGTFLDRLEALELMDRALIIVTADHGMGFEAGTARRGSSREEFARFVMAVPLLVKRPNQHDGEISDRNAEIIDIVPTIANELGLEVPWEVDGRPLFEPHRTDRPTKAFRVVGGSELLQFPARSDTYLAALDRKLALFGSGTSRPGGLFAVGPHQDLLGMSLSSLSPSEREDISVALLEPNAEAELDPEGNFVPAHVVGEVRGLPTGSGALAITLNGTVRAVTETYQLANGDIRFSAMLPEESFVSGSNSIGIALVEGSSATDRKLFLPKTGDLNTIGGEVFEALPETVLRIDSYSGLDRVRSLNEARLELATPDSTDRAALIVQPGRVPAQLGLEVEGVEIHQSLMVRIEIESPATANLRLFYQTEDQPGFHRDQTATVKLARGMNRVVLRINAGGLRGPWRLDPGTVRGRYVIHSIEIRADGSAQKTTGAGDESQNELEP